VEARVQDAEGGVVVSGDYTCTVINKNGRMQPTKQAMLGHARSSDHPTQRGGRLAESRRRFGVQPPSATPNLAPIYVPDGLHKDQSMLEGGFEEGRVGFVAIHAKVDDPVICRPAHNI
jgi:hypothetical protein